MNISDAIELQQFDLSFILSPSRYKISTHLVLYKTSVVYLLVEAPVDPEPIKITSAETTPTETYPVETYPVETYPPEPAATQLTENYPSPRTITSPPRLTIERREPASKSRRSAQFFKPALKSFA
ncbi:hypothetical protein BC938DRAFT_471175 [Jimgerdemannia flammicorona]|uniref:Uncharacterized protein n=1 Tax=Jimgerdemannia flammicorona TaxID=994334 RepID=A0A433Q8L0_9FUNG|nr:hypothetical protein BC938DRAFT_471175 [Jimgerdemannia flammicorona]